MRTDIEDYFPNLSIEDALAALSPIAGCPRTIDLIRLIARPRRARDERRTRNRGIAQGSCLSPLLANLALTGVDRAMGDAGYGTPASPTTSSSAAPMNPTSWRPSSSSTPS